MLNKQLAKLQEHIDSLQEYIDNLEQQKSDHLEIIDELIKMHAYEQRRADLLQKDLDCIDERHYDECEKLKEKILNYSTRIFNLEQL